MYSHVYVLTPRSVAAWLVHRPRTPTLVPTQRFLSRLTHHFGLGVLVRISRTQLTVLTRTYNMKLR